MQRSLIKNVGYGLTITTDKHEQRAWTKEKRRMGFRRAGSTDVLCVRMLA